MANQKDIMSFIGDMGELERSIEMGYIDPNVAFAIDKFASFSLANNTLSLASSFNNLNPFLDAPTELFVSSSSVADDQIVTIHYIDQNRVSKVKTATLNGQIGVSVGTDIYCVWRMYNGNGSDFIGIISIGSEAIPVVGIPAAANTYCNIPASIGGITPINQSQTSVFSIPAGFTGFFVSAEVSADKGADMKAAAMIRQEGGVFRYIRNLSVFENSKGTKLFARLPEKTDIRPLAYAQTGGNVSLEYKLICISNEYMDRYINQGV